MILRNLRNGPIWVTNKKGRQVLLSLGEEADVNPSRYGRDSAFVRGGIAQIPESMLGIRHLYIFGASIMDFSFNQNNNQRECLRLLFENAGMYPPVINTQWANRGQEIDRYESKLPDLLDHARGKDGVWVIYHGPGNNISHNGPWPGDRDVIDAASRRIFESIISEGHNVAITNVSWRKPPFSNPTSPYNLHIIEPLIREYSPDFWADGRPVLDMYKHTIEHPEYLMDDGVHPNDQGRMALRAWAAEKLVWATRRVEEKTTAEDVAGKTVVFSLGDDPQHFNGINGCVRSAEGYGVFDGASDSSYCLGVKTTAGAMLPGVRLRALWHSSVNTQGVGNTGNATSSVENDRLLKTSIFCHSASTVPGVVIIDGLPDGVTGKMRIAATRQASDARIGAYNYRTVEKEINANGSSAAYAEWDFVVEGGEIRLTWQPKDGSTYCYINGIELTFDS